ncbi:MAG: AAA family ATPase [Candidatus Poribacteria bacterium]|nr:AAA family ATPase [Candidatus Poribacteria bacterium]
MSIIQFSMEEVRCFAERQEFNIRPLTFLVGENSTGKTTALACFQVLSDYLIDGGINFNSPPYSMGIFRDIVRNSRKTEKVFTLGVTNGDVGYTVEFAKKMGGVEPVVKSITVKFTDGEIVIRASNTMGDRMRLTSCDKAQNQYHIDVRSEALDIYPPRDLLEDFKRGWHELSEDEKALRDYLEKTEISWRWWHGDNVFVCNTAPIRTQPKRTYNPTRQFYDPEGSHVPMWFMETKATEKEEWETLKDQLVEFGKRSGLFQNIDINNLGGARGNPFQLKVTVRGPNSNIVDVGYGVSQILPILARVLEYPVFRRGTGGILHIGPMPVSLLQQPEVHLHPRAQAELSSLLATLACEGNRAFIVETHSDYMIDRVRVEIRKGTIHPEYVSLINLEPKGNVVKVHNISFDNMGNMENVPPHYREFFLNETDRFMGFED